MRHVVVHLSVEAGGQGVTVLARLDREQERVELASVLPSRTGQGSRGSVMSATSREAGAEQGARDFG